MTWVPLLLSSPSPSLRYLVLRELLGRPEEDEEVCELADLREKDPLIVNLLRLQGSNGSWKAAESVGLTLSTQLLNTAQALTRLGYMGIDPSHPAVKRGVEFIFSLQRADGSWPPPGGSKWKGLVVTPLQTALPLRGLAFCGYATDSRVEKAYAWLLRHRLPDGAWPSRVSADGSYGYRAGYRALPHSRFGCRSNTTGALQCLSLHPEYRHSEQARRALDLLLARETRDRHVLGFDTARMVGVEPARGFLTFFARFDLGLVLDLCWRVGATLEDQRVNDLVSFIKGLQDEYGLWDYENPQASKWVTFDLLRSLSRLDREGEWVSMEPRTPFEGYPRVQRRY